MLKPKMQIDDLGKIKRTVRKAARAVPGMAEASPYTVVKLRPSPVGRLFDDGKISSDEIGAAGHIEKAFHAIAARLMVKGQTFERVDSSPRVDAPWPAIVARSIGHYQAFANHWSRRARAYGDPMLEIIVACVVFQRPVWDVADDVGYARRRVELALIAGLRDFAARAGLVTGALATEWIKFAEAVFVPRPVALIDAERRARIEI